jgi:hypothetical protein
MKKKVCKDCGNEKSIDEFNSYADSRYRSGYWVSSYCLICDKKRQKISKKKRYERKGRQEFIEKYNSDPIFREEHLKKNKKYRDEKKDELKAYREERKEEDRENQRTWAVRKRKTNPSYKLRTYFSNAINCILKSEGGSKRGESMMAYLPYTIEELRKHLESQFEPWMNWDNWGRYDSKTWDDNDFSTWKWSVDHIIPCSDLLFDSFQHPNFLKCWALSNIRPLNAKTNLIDGTQRIRHNSAMHKTAYVADF